MNKTLFLVTSAIHVNENLHRKANLNKSFCLSTKERLIQTRNTINKIDKYVPNSTIYLLDGGIKPIDCEEIEFLIGQQKSCEVNLVNYADDETVIRYHKTNDLNLIKSGIETYMSYKFYLSFERQWHTPKYFMKLSARYCINNGFTGGNENKIFMKKKLNKPFIYSTFYSFSIGFLPNILEVYKIMDIFFNSFLDSGFKTGYTIEHLLYIFLDKQIIYFTDNLGIEGFNAISGEFIDL